MAHAGMCEETDKRGFFGMKLPFDGIAILTIENARSHVCTFANSLRRRKS